MNTELFPIIGISIIILSFLYVPWFFEGGESIVIYGLLSLISFLIIMIGLIDFGGKDE